MTDEEYIKYTAEYLIAHNGDCVNMNYPENKETMCGLCSMCRLCSIKNKCLWAKEDTDRKTAAEVWLNGHK